MAKKQPLFASYIEKAKTILWNGPMGVFESPVLAEGTRLVASGRKMYKNGGVTVVVAGTASAVKKLGFSEVATFRPGAAQAWNFVKENIARH